MKKIFVIILLIFIFGKVSLAQDRSDNSFDVNITQNEIPPGGPVDPATANTGGTSGLSTGGIVGIAVGVGGPTAGGTGAVIAAPLMLIGLSPNSPISAAAPIVCFKNPQCFLKTAIMEHFFAKDYDTAKSELEKINPYFYLAKNDSEIKNRTFDMNTLRIPKELTNNQNIKINITIASEPYKEVNFEPELSLGIYKNINSADLKNKFETQQFLHNYLMKKYEIPLKITSKNYVNGIQKISGTINLSQLQNKTIPVYVVIKYTYNGFQKNRKMLFSKTLTYAYLVEFKK